MVAVRAEALRLVTCVDRAGVLLWTTEGLTEGAEVTARERRNAELEVVQRLGRLEGALEVKRETARAGLQR